MYNLDAENGCFYFIDWNSMYSWILKRSMAFIIIRPYLCNYCKCRFKRKQHLVDHIRIHTGERPYTCGECGNRFKSSSNLYSHMKIHTCLKPYVCKYCTKAFNRKYNLNVHIRNIHHHTMQSTYKKIKINLKPMYFYFSFYPNFLQIKKTYLH